MNYSTAICLVSDEVRGISCSYDLDPEGNVNQLYTFKSLDTQLGVGDLVVIPTDSRHGFTIVRIEEVDVEIPLEDSTDYKWIAARFDIRNYNKVLRYERELISTIKSTEKRRKREELREAVMADVKDEELPTLPGKAIEPDSPPEE